MEAHGVQVGNKQHTSGEAETYKNLEGPRVIEAANSCLGRRLWPVQLLRGDDLTCLSCSSQVTQRAPGLQLSWAVTLAGGEGSSRYCSCPSSISVRLSNSMIQLITSINSLAYHVWFWCIYLVYWSVVGLLFEVSRHACVIFPWEKSHREYITHTYEYIHI